MTSHARSHAVESALRERVKELTCLYGIAQLAARQDLCLSDALSGIGQLVQRAWQYPEITAVAVSADGEAYVTPTFADTRHRQTADVIVAGVLRGRVEVGYTQLRPELDEGPFLKEERHLLNAVASHLESILERLDAEREQSNLQSQLRHADRLATIGQLAAGVAHELNEPLGNILGFAQLLQKSPGLADQTRADIEKITVASLRAREIIRKLLVFARQSAPQMMRVSLARVVDEGLQWFQSRCAQQGIALEVTHAAEIPDIVADPAQLTQVLVNLVVNAMQAMPNGGRLAVRTDMVERDVLIIVEDTGIGMSGQTMDRLFAPFFTTKDVGQGTGLGLSTAHGIVTAHGGDISVESTPGRGSRFKVRLPHTPAHGPLAAREPSCGAEVLKG